MGAYCEAMSNDTKSCVACAQPIPVQASKCHLCRSRQPMPLHRGVPGRMIAGVCAAIARQLGVEPTLIRVAAILLALASVGMVFWAYVLVWVTTPPAPGQEAPIARLFDWVKDLFSPRPQPQKEPPAADRIA